MFILVNSDELPAVIIASKELRGAAFSDGVPHAPHLLELDPYLVESLRYYCYEHVLHQPSQEEDHSAEIEMV